MSPHAFTRLPDGYLENLSTTLRDKQLAMPGSKQIGNAQLLAEETARALTEIKEIELRERLARSTMPDEIRLLLRHGASWNENLPELTFSGDWTGTEEEKQKLIKIIFAFGLAIEI